jgi:hypothetical protein
MKDPETFIRTLRENYKYKLKGVGPISYHLGAEYTRDKDGTLTQGSKRYIEKMIATFEQFFQEKPKEYVSPLKKGDHPELDSSDFVDGEGIAQYQTMIGQLQWCISLGRFDIFTSTMSMSRWRVAPRKGHLDRLKRIYGYLKAHCDGKIRYRVESPNMSGLPEVTSSWEHSVYGTCKEEIPSDIPEALGKEVVLSTYVDANLYHDMITGRAITAVLHFINKTLFEWYSKRQATVESATFSSEFVATRAAVEQIIDNRTTLRYLGVPIKGKTYMFGDNKSVVTNSTIPHSELKKRHVALSYHKTREAIAVGILTFYHIAGALNPADLLSKHWGFAEAWPRLRPILFWMGDTNVSGDGVAVKESKDTSIRNDGECYAKESKSKTLEAYTHCKNPEKPKVMWMERE